MNSNKGRSWPLSIIGIFIFLSFMLFGILYISLKYVPVNRENVYQMGYQEVDKCYNEICEAQEKFEKNYNVSFDMEKLSNEPVETMRVNGEKVYFDHAFRLGKNRFNISVTEKTGNVIKDAKLSLLATRFDTSEFDIVFEAKLNDNNVYESEAFEIKNEGRWKIVAKITIDDETGYFEKDIYAR